MDDLKEIQLKNTKDFTIFEELMDLYSKNIERFAFQYGCTPERAGEVAEAVFRTVYKHFDTQGEQPITENELYSIAITKLLHDQPIEIPSTLLSFEEDALLHNQIIKLAVNEKFSLILSRFHGKTIEEIGRMIGLSHKDVELKLVDAMRHLEGQQLEKRIDLLYKSYERMGTSFMKENVPNQQTCEKEVNKKNKGKKSKKITYFWITGVLLLLALLTVPVVTSEEYRASADEKYVERLKIDFEDWMKSRFDTLGLKEEKELVLIYEVRPIGSETRKKFNGLIYKLDKQIYNGEKINKKQTDKQVEDIMQEFLLPSELVEQILKRSLEKDIEKSETFMDDYITTVIAVMGAYYRKIEENHHIFNEVNRYELDWQDKLPADLQKMVDAMLLQNLDLGVNSLGNYFFPIYNKNDVSSKIRSSIHSEMRGYMTALELLNTTQYNNPVDISFDEQILHIMDMENTLLLTKSTSSYSYSYLLDEYDRLLYLQLIDMKDSFEKVDQGEKVKEKYRLAWELIASNEVESPSAFVMTNILQDLENEDWRESRRSGHIPYFNFGEAVDFARKGKLKEYQWDRYLQSDFQNDDNIETIDATNTESIYRQLAETKDVSILKGSSPLQVVLIFLYANQLEDPETMWLLFDREVMTDSMEAYSTKWEKSVFEMDEVETLKAKNTTIELNGNPAIPITYEKDGTVIYDGWLIWNEENSIWQIYSAPANTIDD